jgi:hypothetical protein
LRWPLLCRWRSSELLELALGGLPKNGDNNDVLAQRGVSTDSAGHAVVGANRKPFNEDRMEAVRKLPRAGIFDILPIAHFQSGVQIAYSKHLQTQQLQSFIRSMQ